MVQSASFKAEAFVPPQPAGGLALVCDQDERPANRAVDVLRLAWADVMENDGAKWSMGQSLRFILATCGMFWIAAAVLYYTVY